jgi:hypothetical protein
MLSFLLGGGGRTAVPTAMDLAALRRRLAGEPSPKVAVIRDGLVWTISYVPSPPVGAE